jgi:hypothetical protein
MKKIINTIALFAIATSMIGVVFAQSYDDVGDFSSYDYGYDSYNNTGSVYDYGWYEPGNPNIPASYDTISNYSYPDATTYYGTQTCVGCDTAPVSNSTSYGWYEPGNPNIPASYDTISNYSYPDATTYYGTQTCVGCNTGTQYVAPTYSNTQYVNPSYVAPTYSTGNTYVAPTYSGYNYSNYTYPTYTYPTTNITRCSDGSAPINGSCTHVTTIPTTTITKCSDGSAPIGGSCTHVTTIPTTTTTVCSDGTLPVNGSCARVVTAPVTTITNCPSNTNFINGVCQQIINPPVVVYQTCWNGAVIPATSTCAPQYKVCANGTSVPVNQACYVTPATPVYVAPPVIKFNNVVTSPVTQITNTSGRCNGIGLIANNVPSTGWFEYGETANLGRTTASAAIGSSPTAPFSNVLANLKPSTKYYCRAVMQNQYGIFKGEIVGFTTFSTATTYIKPIPKPTVKTPVKTNVITCSDGSTIPAKNSSAATLINQGEKLLAVQIEKIDGNLSSGETVHYKVNYKNLVDSRLTGVVVKVVLPQEVLFVGTTAGMYDEMTRTLTLNQDSIDPYTENVITITGKVIQDAPIGKTIVTTVYAVYTVPGTNTQDEVTAYVIGSIVPASTIGNPDTGAKKVIGIRDGRGFMPSSLIEWLALLAILFIIFILGRSIYASYKEDGESKH